MANESKAKYHKSHLHRRAAGTYLAYRKRPTTVTGIRESGGFPVMQIIGLLWIVNFFLFSLILLFVWSKLHTLSNKIAVLLPKVKRVEELRQTKLARFSPAVAQ
jgi:hypothetical protein